MSRLTRELDRIGAMGKIPKVERPQPWPDPPKKIYNCPACGYGVVASLDEHTGKYSVLCTRDGCDGLEGPPADSAEEAYSNWDRMIASKRGAANKAQWLGYICDEYESMQKFGHWDELGFLCFEDYVQKDKLLQPGRNYDCAVLVTVTRLTPEQAEYWREHGRLLE